MSWDRLSLVTGPSAKPISVEVAKEDANVEAPEKNDLVARLIDRATAVIDGPHGIGICMVSQQWKLTLNCFPPVIRIPLGPVISVDAITYIDGDGVSQTWDAANYRVMNAGGLVTIEPAYGLSWPSFRAVSGAVTVTFTAGYLNTAVSPQAGAVPSDLQGAVSMLVAYWINQREAGAEREHFEVPYSVERILAKYRVGTVAA